MTTTKKIWIDPQAGLTVGDVGFLVNRSPQNGTDSYMLQELPAQTNQSHAPRLYGWCGATDNVSTHACGVARVERVARNGRAQVVELAGAELRAALDEMGYPDLMYPELMPADSEVAETVTFYRINDAGLAYLAAELNRLHRKFALFASLDPTLPSHRTMLLAWAADAEARMDADESPEVEIRSFDAVSGHTELVRLDAADHFTAETAVQS